MLYRLTSALILLAACASAAAARPAPAADDVPAWLKAAAAAGVPAQPKDVHAVVLHDESVVTVSADGRTSTLTTYAVRILGREARALAAAAAPYDTDNGGKVRELRAWMVRPDGSFTKYGKNETVDRMASSSNLYDESRVMEIDAEADAEVGYVFGYQSVVEERPWFPEVRWWFQGFHPSRASRLTVVVPPGWRVAGTVFNAAKVEPAVAGNSYTWEMRDLARVEFEPAAPSLRALAAHVAVNYFPDSGATAAQIRAFESWADISKWYAGLADPQSEPDEAISAKARELTAGARTELERVQAIGRYVQNIQYVSIQIGIGGWRPHSAREVFAKQYGDCKDKATLMRAMLKVVGLDSYHVLIYSGDRTRVRDDWASPGQFNHCILAVRVGPETKAPAVVEHARLGRLLIFDATDDSTPVGDLPDDEQGSFALVAAGADGALLRMPVTPPEENMWRREVEAGLAADGSLTATMRERLAGQSAVSYRRSFKGLAKSDFAGLVERWVSGGAAGAKFAKIEPADDHGAGRFALDVEFSAARYGQNMQDRLLVFRPALVSHGGSPRLAEPTRKHPVVLESKAFSETVRFKLPAGFAVDELPDAVKLNAEFGDYTATYEVKDGHLVFTRTLVQRATVLPAARYKEARDFFVRVRASEEAPIVLARQ